MKTLLLASLLLITTKCFSQEWIWCGGDGTNEMYMYHSCVHTRTHALIQVWTKLICPDYSTQDDRIFHNVTARIYYTVDVLSYRVQTLSIVASDSTGVLIENWNNPHPKWDPEPPGTIAYHFINAVKKRFYIAPKNQTDKRSLHN